MPMLNPILRNVPTHLETARLCLRSPKAGDGAILHAAVVDALPALREFIAAVPWVAAEQSTQASEVYCRNAESNFLARREFSFLVFERATLQLIGSAALLRPNWDTPKLEIGYWCRTSQTGKGYITEAVTALVALAQEQLGVARLELITDERNTRSRAVAERTGFVLEGILRNESRTPDGRLRNTCMYARTMNE